MRRRLAITTVLTTTAALAFGAAGPLGASAKPSRATQITCGLELSAQGPPRGAPPLTTSFGVVSCPRPLGNGVHHGTSSTTPTGPGQGTFAVSFKKYFDRGTISGMVAGTFSATGPGQITNQGAVTITGGTGAYRRVKGSGTLTCTSTDGGAHRSCQFTLKLRRI